MGSKQDYDAKDQLYAMMCSVISKRKEYPAIVSRLEEERITNYLKNLDEAKVELDDEDYKKELKCTNNFIKKQMIQIPTDSLTRDAENRFIKSKRSMEKVKNFLEMRGKY